jgi:hypothetical protein
MGKHYILDRQREAADEMREFYSLKRAAEAAIPNMKEQRIGSAIAAGIRSAASTPTEREE